MAEEQQRQRLLAELAANAAQLRALEFDHARLLEAGRSSTADDEHDPEGATLAFEREQLTAILARARQAGADLRQALADLDRGRYGVCERCGQPIGAARLEVRPQARTCIACAASGPVRSGPVRSGADVVSSSGMTQPPSCPPPP